MRRKYQLTRNRVQLQNRLEALLEEAHIKLSSLVSDLLGASARRMLRALADGETNPAALAALADKNCAPPGTVVRCTRRLHPAGSAEREARSLTVLWAIISAPHPMREAAVK